MKKRLFILLSCGLILTSFVACKNTSANTKAQSVAEQNIQTSEDEDATDINTYLSEYDITVEDIEYVANIFKQTNEGNDNGLISGEDYYEEELKYAKLGAAMGDAELALWVGEIYQGMHVEGLTEEESVEMAIEWWNKANEMGQPRGLTDIGLLYAHNKVPGGGEYFGNIEQDDAKAIEYFTEACELGDLKAPRYLAQFYEEGRGCDIDYAKALEYYTIAADLDDITAQECVGVYYLKGNGTDVDYDKAIDYLTKAATSEKVVPGVADARYYLGTMYENGLGVEKDMDEAIKWYTSAAEEGSEEAQKALDKLSE